MDLLLCVPSIHILSLTQVVINLLYTKTCSLTGLLGLESRLRSTVSLKILAMSKSWFKDHDDLSK